MLNEKFKFQEPGKFSQLVKQDEYVKNLLNRNSASNKKTLPKQEKLVDSECLVKEHLLMTKAELSKCLGKILDENNMMPSTAKNTSTKATDDFISNKTMANSTIDKNYEIFNEN